MAWTLVSLGARITRALPSRRAFVAEQTTAKSLRVAAAAADRPDVFARACQRRLRREDAFSREALEGVLDQVRGDSPVFERAIASGAPVEAVVELARTWPDVDVAVKELVRHPGGAGHAGPLDWLRITPTQVDATTCGAASMGMMLAMGDPFVALWLATGRRGSWYLPPEVARAQTVHDDESVSLDTISERWDALQRVLHEKVTRFGVGLAPWPRAFGTPPWRIDNATRFAGLRFGGHVVDDAQPAELLALVTHARAALADGIPVPMYVSGDSSRGVDKAIPRHVVLLVGADGDDFLVYEPSSGTVHKWTPEVAGERNLKAFGGWNRVAWVILPRWRV